MQLVTMLLSIIIVSSACILGTEANNWRKTNHQHSFPIQSGMAYMKSSSPKFFGVGIGILWERVWVKEQNQWQWVNHGAPSFLKGGDRLVSTPCVLADGKVFVVTTEGNLVERVWNGKGWVWTNHGKPFEHVKVHTTKCATSQGNERGRIFLVGIDGCIYQRAYTYKYNKWGWYWRNNGCPSGAQIKHDGIDASYLHRFHVHGKYLYAVGTNGNLYRLLLGTNHHGTWHTLNRPNNEKIAHLSVGHSVMVTTEVHRLWRHWNHAGFSLKGERPHGVLPSDPPLQISKSVGYPGGSCGGNSILAVLQSKRKLWGAKFTSEFGPRSYEDIATSDKDLTNVPAITSESGKCPKLFVTTVHGTVVEYWK